MTYKRNMTVDACMTYNYARSHFDDLDLDLMSQWFGRGKHSALNYPDNKAKQ